jgi:hypothetical protein
MAKFGWVFEQAYVITEKGISDQNVYHFLLSKDITSDEEITDGIVTAKDVQLPQKKKEKAVMIYIIDKINSYEQTIYNFYSGILYKHTIYSLC